jgi:hypothetical protein
MKFVFFLQDTISLELRLLMENYMHRLGIANLKRHDDQFQQLNDRKTSIYFSESLLLCIEWHSKCFQQPI